MIVKDEAPHLADCLDSVKTLVDEMIVVDTGSSDDTVAIAKKMSAKVHFFAWQDDFAKARNFCLEHATCDWILVLDADEIIDPAQHGRIRDLIQKKDVDAYRLVQYTYQGRSTLAGLQAIDKQTKFSRGCPGFLKNPIVRLFRNQPKVRFKGRLHEVVEQDLLSGQKVIVDTDIPIHHYEKLLGPDRLFNKQRLYRDIGEAKIKQDPNNDRGLCELGVLYLEMNQPAEAERVLQKACEVAPDNLKAAFNLGVALANQGKKETAAQIYRKILKQDQNHIGAANNLAQILQDNGQDKEALTLYQKALEYNPRQHVLHYNCGLVFEKIGQTNLARKHFQKAVEIDPAFEQAKIRLAHISTDTPEASAMTDKNDSKSTVDRFLTAGIKHQQINRWAEALEAYVSAMEIRPNDAEIRYRCGYVLEKLSQKEAAIQQYQEALAIAPKHVKTLWRLALEAGRQELFEDAVALYREILSVDDNHTGAHLKLAEAFESHKQPEQALSHFKKVLATAPKNPEARAGCRRLQAQANIQNQTSQSDPGFKALRIVFVWGGKPFRGDSLAKQPLGGTETALIHMARSLADLGHEVLVYLQDGADQYEGVRYEEIAGYVDALKKMPADVLIAARSMHPFSIPVAAGLKIFWTEDAHDQPFVEHLKNSALIAQMDKIFTVSRWQTESLKKTFNLAEDKFYITQNGVLWDRFRQNGNNTNRDPKRLVYTSTPFRGLDVLLALFPRIKARVPEATLDVYSSMAVYQVDKKTDQTQYGDLYGQAAQPGVTLKGSVLQDELSQALKQAAIMVYPNHFAETSCIAAMEAMAAGMPVVTTQLGALPETVAAGGILIDGDAHSRAYQDLFVDQVCALLNDPAKREKLGRAASDHIRHHNRWETIARQWSQTFETLLETKANGRPEPNAAKSPEQMMAPEDLPENLQPVDAYFGTFFDDLRQAVSVGGSEFGLGLSLFSLAVSIRAATIIEIGRFKGFSTLALAGALKFIDLGWQEPGQHKHRPDIDYNQFEEKKARRLFSIDPHPTKEAVKRIQNANLNPYVEFIDKYSGQVVFKTQADLIFIDGDHSYEGCKKDVDRFIPDILRPGGYFILHDYFGWYDEKGQNNSPIKQVADELIMRGQYQHILMDTGYQSFMVFRKPVAEP
jgi:tetratricopeptide (TPR) repeat protein/predicted O-methyltransferase YrrM